MLKKTTEPICKQIITKGMHFSMLICQITEIRHNKHQTHTQCRRRNKLIHRPQLERGSFNSIFSDQSQTRAKISNNTVNVFCQYENLPASNTQKCVSRNKMIFQHTVEKFFKKPQQITRARNSKGLQVHIYSNNHTHILHGSCKQSKQEFMMYMQTQCQ